MKKLNDPLQRIRRATAPLHTDLDQMIDPNLMLSRPEKQHYARLLTGHLHYHQEVEFQLNAWLGARNRPQISWPACERKSALEQDLRRLQLPAKAWKRQLDYRSPAFAVGLCYVREGAARGNSYLLKKLREHPEFRSWEAEAYLEKSTLGFPARWKILQEWIGHYGTEDYLGLEAGARAGFLLFQQLWREMAPELPQAQA